MLRLILAIVVTVDTAGILTGFEASDKAPQEWTGKIAQPELRKVAPKSGYIKDAGTFQKIWTAWRPDEQIPKIDFEEKLVVFGTVNGPNLVIVKPSLNDKGDLKFVVGGTRIGGPGFGYKLMVVDREGVKSVNGKAVDATETEESIRVRVVGTLKTGIAAIGGETTGTTVTANGITWELDFADNDELRRKAESLDGQQVLARGSLERKTGVEIKERWIVTVSKLRAAE
jgi:hypothetical protein